MCMYIVCTCIYYTCTCIGKGFFNVYIFDLTHFPVIFTIIAFHHKFSRLTSVPVKSHANNSKNSHSTSHPLKLRTHTQVQYI